MARDLIEEEAAINGKCSQALMVDAYTCVEVERLRFIAGRQEDLRSALYRGLFFNGSSSVGVADVQVQTYPDAVSLFLHVSSPSLSITVACRPECAGLLRTNPSSVTTCFILELNKMMGDFFAKSNFGTVVASVRAVAFRPLALPRAHILLFMACSGMLRPPCITVTDLSEGMGALALDFVPALHPSPLFMEAALLDRVPGSAHARCVSLCPTSDQASLLRLPPALRLLHGASGSVVPHYPTNFGVAASRNSYGFHSYARNYNMAACCGNFGFKAARVAHILGHTDELLVEILSWLDQTDLENCKEVCPGWKRLINNDAQFLALHTCRGGDWKNWPPITIKDFVASAKKEGTCRAFVLTLCKATVEVRCSHVLESYPQNYFANQDELIYIRNKRKMCLRCGERTLHQLHVTARCHILLNDGSATWRKILHEDVVEQLLRKRLCDVLAVDNAFIANNVHKRRSEALDHSAILRSHLEGMEVLFKIEYDGPGEPVNYQFLIVSSGHPIQLHAPSVSTNTKGAEPACIGKSWVVVNDF